MPDRYPCAHCGTTGSCKSGRDGVSCAVCVRDNKLPADASDSTYVGLACSVCAGAGSFESTTDRLRRRVVPVLALLIVYLALAMIWANADKSTFHELLAFGGTLIGSITGYYFAGKARDGDRS